LACGVATTRVVPSATMASASASASSNVSGPSSRPGSRCKWVSTQPAVSLSISVAQQAFAVGGKAQLVGLLAGEEVEASPLLHSVTQDREQHQNARRQRCPARIVGDGVPVAHAAAAPAQQ